MIKCKKCGYEKVVKNGIIRGIQRYKCKKCGCNFRLVDDRKKPQNELKKILAILLYSCARTSFNRIAKILGVSDVAVLKWIRSIAKNLPEPEISKEIRDVEFDEMWHFLKKSPKKYGSLEQFAGFQAEFLDLSVVIGIKKLSRSSTKTLNT